MTTQFVSRGRELEVDLESGGTTNQEDKVSDPISANGQTKTILKRACTGPMGFHRLANSSNFSELAAEDVELLIDNNSEGEEGQQNITFVDRKDVVEKRIKKNWKPPPKPPRPPKGLSLDAADQKLMKEITELAMRKRARIERLKAIKKMRAAKTSSWSSSLSAMVITIVFCLIILYQGILAFRSFDLSHTKNCVHTAHMFHVYSQ
ncbi:PROTEIN putative-RELATED [Salix viminalis]|uniref:PROTEIN putative-RELATED n=1 Tax=Salix viminalis TaxID=40686 RepID=A0A9Q0SFD1_SALVM|nr:PROTEIN putative-RELATED [Salix viminalis]KAJ6675030.1 PROTEIN putative-RELATED [Salix viminalis]